MVWEVTGTSWTMCIFFGLKRLLFNNGGFSREVSPVLIFKKWGKILCARMVITQKRLYGKCDEIFAYCFRIKLSVLEWNNLSPMLYIQLYSGPTPLAASHLWLFSLGHYFKKTLKTLLTAISSELMMPSLAGAFCSKRNTASYYEPADSYYLCNYSRQS